jgi:hypothetical protein
MCTLAHRFDFGRERAEEPIPDDERAGVVLVLVLRVHPVMHAVM